MPEPAEPPAAPATTLQAEISAKTKAAVQDTGFDAGFDAEIEAAIKADEGVREAKATGKPVPPPAPVKPAAAAAKAVDAPMDVPGVLLGEKKVGAESKGAEGTDADREKFIKEQTAGLSPKAADRFRALEKTKWEAEQKAARADKLEKELAAAQERLKSAADNTETLALKKQVEELDEIVSKTALTEHPKFKAAFDNQIAKAVAEAKKQVGEEAASEVEALLSLPETAQRNRRLNEILQDLEPVQAGKFTRAIADVDKLAGERAAELGNWRQNKTRMAELSAKDAAENQEARAKTVEAALKTVLPKFTGDKGVELFRKVDGNEEWNKSVDARLENVKKLVAADLSREDIAEMASWAMSGAEYRNLFLTQRALVAKLQEEISAMKGGEPNMGTGGGADDSDGDESGGMIDIITRAARKSGAVR